MRPVTTPAAARAAFSEKEKEIIRLICQDYKTREIAEQLDMSIRTVEDNSYRIKRKMGVRGLAGMAVFALKWKLIRPKEL